MARVEAVKAAAMAAAAKAVAMVAAAMAVVRAAVVTVEAVARHRHKRWHGRRNWSENRTYSRGQSQWHVRAFCGLRAIQAYLTGGEERTCKRPVAQRGRGGGEVMGQGKDG